MFFSKAQKAVLLTLLFSVFLMACKSPDNVTAKKSYSFQKLQSEICSNPKQCVTLDDHRTVFIDKGWLFLYDNSNHTKTYVKNTSNLVEIIPYKGNVVGLVQNGTVYIGDESLNWVLMGRNALHIASQGDDLLAITGEKGKLERYESPPGRLFCYEQVIFLDVVVVVPTCNGRVAALKATGVEGIESFYELESRELMLEKKSGELVPYQKI